jgi:predicted RNA-binding protein with PIN domain
VSWIVDGSNVLGVMRADLHSDDSKRQLVRMLASFSRAKRTRVVCCFDGSEPPSFAKVLGSVTVVFSGKRPADELIVQRAQQGGPHKVVTSDRGLAARIAGRRVEIVASATLLRELESLPSDESVGAAEDWISWFSDPKNRNRF